MRKVGVEGTGSYGAGLSRFLRTAGLTVIEVNRPNREERRRSGKSDPLDAIEAARAALGGKAKSIAKSKDGAVEGIRALVVAKRSGESGPRRRARPDASADRHHARPATKPPAGPDRVRPHHRGGSAASGTSRRPVFNSTKASLCSLAGRVQGLDDELAELDARIEALLKGHCPELLGRFGVGPDTAATLVVCAGDNAQSVCTRGPPGRIVGVAPSRPAPGRPLDGSESITPATGRPTPRSGAS